MKRRSRWHPGVALVVFLAAISIQPGFGWGKTAHKIINLAAAEALPRSMPAFLRSHSAVNEIEYLGPEPDRWRSPAEPELSVAQAPEHFIDLELADEVAPGGLPPKRGDFLREMALTRGHNPQMAGEFSPQKVGLLPWAIEEWYERLSVDMHDYRIRRAGHQPLRSVEQAILYDAGILGHFIADGSQPLHTTLNYNGWVEMRNPEHFTRGHCIHHEFEADFVDRNIRARDIKPRISASPQFLVHPFQDYVSYLRASHTQVDELYRLEKEGGFRGRGTLESRSFVAARMAAGATMLRNAIYTAWLDSAREARVGQHP